MGLWRGECIRGQDNILESKFEFVHLLSLVAGGRGAFCRASGKMKWNEIIGSNYGLTYERAKCLPRALREYPYSKGKLQCESTV
jgi:hypothetical protein